MPPCKSKAVIPITYVPHEGERHVRLRNMGDAKRSAAKGWPVGRLCPEAAKAAKATIELEMLKTAVGP